MNSNSPCRPSGDLKAFTPVLALAYMSDDLEGGEEPLGAFAFAAAAIS
jgi:hypothetical protein